jgi:antitoxin (DNA-binding transcriptional repressor) of toxin-antitoxin stability system
MSIQDLKARLSSAIAEAEAGHTIVITRHHAAVAKLSPADQHLHRGKRFGQGGLTPAIKTNAKIPYLQALADDRSDR